MNPVLAGNTTNFSVYYDSSLPNQSVVIANANALLGVVENEFTVTTGPGWFNTPSGKFGSSNRQRVNLYGAPGTGASNQGYGSAINVDSQDVAADSTTGGKVESLFMAEWSEILMSITNNWNSGDSSGEGLSQFASILRFQVGHYNYYNYAGRWFFQGWLNGTGPAIDSNTGNDVTSPNAGRSDWVNTTFTGGTFSGNNIHGDGDTISFGCALGFIFYLNVQLSFPINAIISHYKSNLASIYKAVTGDNGDPFPFFLNLISSVYPASSTASIPAPVRDNPFPITIVSLGGKNTFGLDEAKDIIDNQGGLVAGGLWVEVTGFSKNSFNALKVTADNNFTGTFAGLNGVVIAPNSEGPQFQAGVSDLAPQTIMIPYDLTLSEPFLSASPGPYTLTGALHFTDNFTNPSSPTVKQVTGGTNSMQYEIIAGADPYFQNQDVKQNNYPYLSQDLRVFQATPAQVPVPIPGGPTLSDSISGAYQYIQDLLTHLNNSTDFTNPNGSDPFDSFPDQYGENQTDSNVTPGTFNNNTFPPTYDHNYNFAVARVRLLGTAGMSGEATDVRVFFRLFAAQTNDTDYDINTTYPSTADAAGKPGSPLVGSNNVTIPMFATNNLPTQTDYVDGGPNKATIEIPTGLNGVYHYYGCFLNVYDQNNYINGQPISALLPSTHNCIVAQIAYDDAPIPQGASPLSWDQLAQRNLTIAQSDNPGPAETHRVPQTFDCRPSGLIVPPGPNTTPVPPDELVIDWGDVPEGSMASIYWPKVNAADVIALATKFYATNPLLSSDSHTLTLSVAKGLSYIPIPSGAGESFAGLFTIDLPPSQVSTGQTFEILVRRLSSMSFTPEPPPQAPRRTTHTMPAHGAVKPAEAGERKEQATIHATQDEVVRALAPYAPFSWRYNVGSFSVKIPVTTGDQILPSEENTFAIMSWRLQQMAPANRWYPVLQRYISYISDRISGLGGDPSTIPPSPTGAPVKVQSRERCYTGKVCEVVYDCHGDFEAFVLDICCDERKVFKVKEKGVCEVALRTLIEGLLLTVVVVETKDEDKICGLRIRP
jgi:hypothetical protein